MKYRVFTENGDILFYGFNSQASRRYSGWRRVAFTGSPEQHAQLTAHLNRHNSSWLFEDRRSLEEGVMIYDLPPYFKVEAVEDTVPETDAAVHYVNPAITEPTFPAPHAEDPYTALIDWNYAFKGERFRSEETRAGKKIIRYGTFAMDGNAISPNFGWLKAEEEGNDLAAEAKRDAYDADRPGAKPYINVHYDDRPAGYYDAAVPRLPKRGSVPAQEYVPQGAGWPNEALVFGPNIKIYGLPEVAARKSRTLAESRARKKKADAERNLASAKQRLEEAQRALDSAERALRNLG